MSQDIIQNNKRIAKNTIMLFFRTMLIMAVSLYTSRVLISTLGIEDYGLYNVIGGVVVIFSSLTASLAGASSRFITYELGCITDDNTQLKKTFSSILTIHYLLSLFILILGETIGLWFVCNKLVIPIERFDAAMWVYQCSLVATVLTLVSVPYNALIIAHEKMAAFAYISLVECTLKLLIIYLIVKLPFDNLIVYAILMALTQLLIRFVYTVYSKKNFAETNTNLSINRGIFIEVGKFTAWSFGGSMAYVGFTQGINILLNMFFGPVVNAARAVSVQVQAACLTIVSNFQTAVKPQITKSFAIGDLQRMHELICMSSKYGFYLLLLLVFPLEMLITPILNIWLSEIPDHTISFCMLLLLVILTDPFKIPIIASVYATGNIRKFQTVESLCLLSIIPIAYILLRFFSISPEVVIVIYLCIEYITQIVRLLIVLPKIKFALSTYVIKVIVPIILPIAILVITFLFKQDSILSLGKLVLYALMWEVYTVLVIGLTGLTNKERQRIIELMRKKIFQTH